MENKILKDAVMEQVRVLSDKKRTDDEDQLLKSLMETLRLMDVCQDEDESSKVQGSYVDTGDYVLYYPKYISSNNGYLKTGNLYVVLDTRGGYLLQNVQDMDEMLDAAPDEIVKVNMVHSDDDGFSWKSYNDEQMEWLTSPGGTPWVFSDKKLPSSDGLTIRDQVMTKLSAEQMSAEYAGMLADDFLFSLETARLSNGGDMSRTFDIWYQVPLKNGGVFSFCIYFKEDVIHVYDSSMPSERQIKRMIYDDKQPLDTRSRLIICILWVCGGILVDMLKEPPVKDRTKKALIEKFILKKKSIQEIAALQKEAREFMHIDDILCGYRDKTIEVEALDRKAIYAERSMDENNPGIWICHGEIGKPDSSRCIMESTDTGMVLKVWRYGNEKAPDHIIEMD